MIIDNTVEVDSPIYADTEYQPGNELIVWFRNGGGYLLVFDVSEETFLKLQKDPSHERIINILRTHSCHRYTL